MASQLQRALQKPRSSFSTPAPMDEDDDSAAVSVASEAPQELPSEDEEMDELASEMDEDPIERIPGESLLPAKKLEDIIKSHNVLGTLALSREALYVLSIATEEFIQRLAQGGHRQASVERRPLVTYRDMAATTQQYQEFLFLRETVPFPVSAKEAMELREEKQKEMIANDPALIESTNSLNFNGSTPASYSTKPKTTKSKANGKEKAAKQGNASSGRSKSANVNTTAQARWDYSQPAAPATSAGVTTNGHAAEGWSRWAPPNGAQPMFPTDPRLNGLLANANAHVALNGLPSSSALAAGSALIGSPYQRTATLWSTPTALSGAAVPVLTAPTVAKPAAHTASPVPATAPANGAAEDPDSAPKRSRACARAGIADCLT
ncbi:CBFD-NFYB-HMF domain-containing protein [Mycena kentingensis (nom. inval.)]|nr:CBFD-NFYB-HMF domain-containing protein [Mycena kentingensis (nom. inval.)]